jgi:hypothetical protein
MKITEGWERLPGAARRNRLRSLATLLHRHGGCAWKRHTVLRGTQVPLINPKTKSRIIQVVKNSTSAPPPKDRVQHVAIAESPPHARCPSMRPFLVLPSRAHAQV